MRCFSLARSTVPRSTRPAPATSLVFCATISGIFGSGWPSGRQSSAPCAGAGVAICASAGRGWWIISPSAADAVASHHKPLLRVTLECTISFSLNCRALAALLRVIAHRRRALATHRGNVQRCRNGSDEDLTANLRRIPVCVFQAVVNDAAARRHHNVIGRCRGQVARNGIRQVIAVLHGDLVSWERVVIRVGWPRLPRAIGLIIPADEIVLLRLQRSAGLGTDQIDNEERGLSCNCLRIRNDPDRPIGHRGLLRKTEHASGEGARAESVVAL